MHLMEAWRPAARKSSSPCPHLLHSPIVHALAPALQLKCLQSKFSFQPLPKLQLQISTLLFCSPHQKCVTSNDPSSPNTIGCEHWPHTLSNDQWLFIIQIFWHHLILTDLVNSQWIISTEKQVAILYNTIWKGFIRSETKQGGEKSFLFHGVVTENLRPRRKESNKQGTPTAATLPAAQLLNFLTLVKWVHNQSARLNLPVTARHNVVFYCWSNITDIIWTF